MLKTLNADGNSLVLTLDDYLNGLKVTGSNYQGVCSDGGILVKGIKGKSVQNFGGGGDFS